jgi:hypothetical protein
LTKEDGNKQQENKYFIREASNDTVRHGAAGCGMRRMRKK